ncbi:histone H1-like [Sphaerodactylus townsendi]|uniref:histone H1-like n=1 Tax=Sphaerodactylus townsendi TaxID=933632 RepID=UPI002025FBDB|nr:histone H1-like [Sphaerodactylus townsendi]
MSETAPEAPAPAAPPPKAPAKKAPAAPKKTPAAAAKKPRKAAGPSVTELLTKAVAASKERHGVSLAALKKVLAAAGYDVDKNNSRIKIGLKSLVTKGTLLQTKGTGASGSFKINKKQADASAAKGPKDKAAAAKKKQPAAKKTKAAAKKPSAAAAKKTIKKAPLKKSPKKPAPKKTKAPAKKPAPAKSPKKAKAPAKTKKTKAAAKSPAKPKAAKPKPKVAKTKKAAPASQRETLALLPAAATPKALFRATHKIPERAELPPLQCFHASQQQGQCFGYEPWAAGRPFGGASSDAPHRPTAGPSTRKSPSPVLPPPSFFLAKETFQPFQKNMWWLLKEPLGHRDGT